MKSSPRFWPLAALILLPVLVLAGVAAWGLGSQRKAVLADAQEQARKFVTTAASKLDEELATAAARARATKPVTLPIPPAATGPEVAAFAAAVDSHDRAALEKLAVSPNAALSEAGLPISTLAALVGLEMGPPVAPEFSRESHASGAPSLLTEKWLLRLEAAVAALPPEPPAGLTTAHPLFLARHHAARARDTWTHDEWVRRAFWDAAAQDWKTRQPGPHVVSGEVFWISRTTEPVADSAVSPPDGNILCVLTGDDLAALLAASLQTAGLPPWMGVTVRMEGIALGTVRKYPRHSVTLVTAPDGSRRIAQGVDESDEWLDPAPAGEVLATAQGNFTIRATLKNPDTLFAATGRMATWTGWLLAGSVFSAGIGLWLVRRTLNKERRLGELKSQFVSSVSHELRAPVGSLRLMAEGLASGKVSGAAADEFHRLMTGEGARLSSLIENVLDFARIEQGRKQYTFAETDVAALVQDAVKVMTPQAEARGQKILTNLQPLPFVPQVDAGALQQALINLLDNALKFSPPNSEVRVALTHDPSAKTWSLSVADDGPGIPAAEHARIFERFYRLGNELRRETNGAGIGLAIVKHIVDAHDGRVAVESHPGAGSEFRMEFPTRSAQCADEDNALARAARGTMPLKTKTENGKLRLKTPQ